MNCPEFIFCVTIAAAVVMAMVVQQIYFSSNLPIHIHAWLSRDPELHFNTRDDWDTKLCVTLPAFWSELLTCPTCLSVHFSFWCAQISGLLGGIWWESWSIRALIFWQIFAIGLSILGCRLITNKPH